MQFSIPVCGGVTVSFQYLFSHKFSLTHSVAFVQLLWFMFLMWLTVYGAIKWSILGHVNK